MRRTREHPSPAEPVSREEFRYRATWVLLVAAAAGFALTNPWGLLIVAAGALFHFLDHLVQRWAPVAVNVAAQNPPRRTRRRE